MKKNLLKKIAMFAMMGAMALSLVACGDEKKDESKKSDEKVDIVVGSESFLGTKFNVPEGFVEQSKDATSVSYIKSDDVTAFIIAVSGMEGLTEAAVVSQFDSQIATVFGDQCTSSEVTYNGYTATEWDTNAPDGSYKGRSMVIADADADKLIYIEYVTYSGTLDAYYEFAKSFSY